ncbi:MAG: hypothetical protein ACSNEK_04690 [Parachlamydiaceae bacterium]
MMHRAIQVIAHREPSHSKANFCSHKGRYYAIINAAIYSTRMVTDPFFALCYTIMHLFKLIYYQHSHPNRKKELIRKEIYQLADAAVYLLCSPFLNALLTSKLLCGGLVPRICYREVSYHEKCIFKDYKRHYKKAARLAHQTIINVVDGKAKVEVINELEKVRKDSQAARDSYYQIKLYAF